MLFGIVPFLFFVLCAVTLFSFLREDSECSDARVALLTACILSSIWMVAGAELLSLFRAIRFWPILLWWVAPAVVMGAVLVGRRARLRPGRWARPHFDALDLLLTGLIAFLVVTAGVSAWFSAPNNADSMAYHLPRQVYWIQNHSVSHYPPHNLMQILMPPFSEFMGMHLMLLSGGDHWANLVQWFSLVMVLMVVSLIARDLGAGRKGQLLAALLVAAAPPVYLFASNTKNDLVLALWMCLLAWWAVRTFIDRGIAPLRAALVGATLGLALLTKGTGYLFAAPICIFMGIAIIRSTRRFARPAFIIGVCALLVTLGHWTRNYKMYGSVLVVEEKFPDLHQAFTPAAFASNIVRNLTLHMGLPSEAYNDGLTQSVEDLHLRLGIDTRDRRTTFKGLRYKVRYDPHDEDRAPAGAHLILVGMTLLLALPFRRRLNTRLFLAYLIIPVAGFVLFCIFLKWTPWHARLHIPLLCLFVPPVAVMLTKSPLRIISPIAVAGVLAAFLPTIADNSRPILGERSIFKSDRTSQMFFARPDLMEGCVAAADLVEEIGANSVGSYLGRREWEYPLQRLILDRMPEPPVFSSFDARLNGKWNDLDEPPEVVISIERHDLEIRDEYSGDMYDIVAYYSPYSVYIRRDLAGRVKQRGPLPPFVGWEDASGLRSLEGPYPEWNLPVVRWGIWPRTEIRFESDGNLLILSMVCGPHHLLRQDIIVLLNGEQIARYGFDGSFEFSDIRAPLAPSAGGNMLTLQYQSRDTADPEQPLALLFKSLRILPVEFDATF